MTRLPNWQTALHSLLEANRHRSFQYGEWDCCLMVCDCILAMTGVDVADAFRGTYSDRPGAYAALRAFAGKPGIRATAEKITHDHGMAPCAPLMAQRGDVVLIRRGKADYSLGIIGLNGTDVIALQSKGLLQVPLALAAQCWRV